MPERNSVRIENLADFPEHFQKLGQWLTDEWGDISKDPVEMVLADNEKCPPNLIALRNDEPVGVLAFKRHPLDENKNGSGDKLWINVLYVTSECRDQGVGSALLAEGQQHAASQLDAKLYVYTDSPSYYEQRSWKILKTCSKPQFRILELDLPTA